MENILASLSAIGIRGGMFLEFVLFVSRPDTLSELDCPSCAILRYSVEYIILVLFQPCLLHSKFLLWVTLLSIVFTRSLPRARLDLNLSRSALVNYHSGGGRTVDKLKKFDFSVVGRLKSEIVILELGSNDLSPRPDPNAWPLK